MDLIKNWKLHLLALLIVIVEGAFLHDFAFQKT